MITCFKSNDYLIVNDVQSRFLQMQFYLNLSALFSPSHGWESAMWVKIINIMTDKSHHRVEES